MNAGVRVTPLLPHRFACEKRESRIARYQQQVLKLTLGGENAIEWVAVVDLVAACTQAMHVGDGKMRKPIGSDQLRETACGATAENRTSRAAS